MTIKNTNIKSAYEAAVSLVEGVGAINEEYDAAAREFHGSYTGAMLADKLKELREAQDAQIAALRDRCLPAMREGIEKARTAVAEAAAKPIPEEVSSIFKDMDGVELGEYEKRVIAEKAAGNYLAKIKADVFLGTNVLVADGVPTLEDAHLVLDQLQDIHERAASGSLGEYATKMLLIGDYHSLASGTVEDFLAAYGN